ncbi:hypothetical protein [Comamonas koreensis]|uniref:HEAT repeat domain-containing protein n=1 Tax=Comamonas koreensis TaxID=160825 RepID=A0AAW4XRX0_9BURK|nr:hypothetical protein [Comamonas koreensis]MCD2164077.1 hypothetical protein [Comamonas koreensis]
MASQQESSDRVLKAVAAFVSSLYSGRSVCPDMSSLIQATSSLRLSSFDDWEQLVRSGIDWAENKHKPPKWRFWAAPTPFPTWIDLCSWDGYKRERTLRALAGAAPNAFFLALAARRLNDWVPEVRAAARETLPSIAAASDPAEVASMLCAVLPHWNSWGRMEAHDKQVLLEISSTEAVVCALTEQIISTPAGPMAEILAQVGRSPALDASLQDIASQAVQPAVRAKAYRAMLDGKMVWLEGRVWECTDRSRFTGYRRAVHGHRSLSGTVPSAELLKAAIADPSNVVRRVVGDVLIRETEPLDGLALELAIRLAADKHPSLSARGQFLLENLTKPKPDA